MTDDGFPSYDDVEHGLLCFLFAHCPAGRIMPTQVYGPLADAFHLTPQQRRISRWDKDEPAWNNRVQWARRSLVDSGLMNRGPHGFWSLTEKGRAEAARTGRPTFAVANVISPSLQLMAVG